MGGGYSVVSGGDTRLKGYFSFVFPAPCPQRCVAGVADNDFAKGVKGILDMFPVIFCAGHGNSPLAA